MVHLRKENPYGPCWEELALGGAENVALVTKRILAYPKGGASGRTMMGVRGIIWGRDSVREEEGPRTDVSFSSWRTDVPRESVWFGREGWGCC